MITIIIIISIIITIMLIVVIVIVVVLCLISLLFSRILKARDIKVGSGKRESTRWSRQRGVESLDLKP